MCVLNCVTRGLVSLGVQIVPSAGKGLEVESNAGQDSPVAVVEASWTRGKIQRTVNKLYEFVCQCTHGAGAVLFTKL